MTVIIFILILSVLVFVHELGHFLAAKKAGVAVEEFGFGYPPRAISLGKRWGTLFSINWIPFGGFVKILGENYEEDSEVVSASRKNENFSSQNTQKSTDKILLNFSSSSPQSGSLASSEYFVQKNFRFTEVSKKWQATILAAGVTFNIIFAWMLFSLSFLIGVPAPLENDFGGQVENPVTTVVSVLEDSPASLSGLKTGDKIIEVSDKNSSFKSPTTEQVSGLINTSEGLVGVKVERGNEIFDFEIEPNSNLVEGKKAIGISMDTVGTLKLPIHKALYQGVKATFTITYLTVSGTLSLIKDAFMGQADVSQVSGPVGIVGLVGDASKLGFSYLVTFTALISINLAVINLLPFPALDGGRLVFVAVEAITKRPINKKFAEYTNVAGFFILIALMLFVTYRDILKLI